MNSLRSLILNEPVKKFIKRVTFPYFRKKWEKNDLVQQWLKDELIPEDELRSLVFEWERFGNPSALPHKIKQQMVRKYAVKNECRTLVETGTYKGDMIYAQLNNFDEIISIELNSVFWEKAKIRFKDYPKVSLIQGDSAKELYKVCAGLKNKTLFWLDGHYCGGDTAKGEVECPILDELKAIFNSSIVHTILIDDARYFVGKRDYPTIEELNTFILNADQRYKLDREMDILVVSEK